MISVFMYNGNWRIKIGDEGIKQGQEVFEFSTKEEMKKVFNTLVDLKSDYGRIKNEPV